jgi:hypothetical protein
MPMIMKVLPDKDGESIDTPKLFTNVDKEDFSFTWVGDWVEFNRGTDANEQPIIDRKQEKTDYVVKAGETVSLPKYLVNYAATHLTNKILKREAFEAIPDAKDRKLGIVNWQNEEKANELSAKIVAKNYENTSEEKEVEFKCEQCGKTFETANKLQGHKLGAKH